MYKHILVATDCSPLADRGVHTAVDLAAFHGAALTVMLVVGDHAPDEFDESVVVSSKRPEARRKKLVEAGRARLDQSLQAIGGDKPFERIVAVGESPAQEIVDQARRSACDLIVMTSHGRTALTSAFLGSQTVRVLTLSKVPVLVVR